MVDGLSYRRIALAGQADGRVCPARAIRRYDGPSTIETRILGYHRCVQDTQSGTKDHLQLGVGRENSLSQG